jgi:hypothetical protein
MPISIMANSLNIRNNNVSPASGGGYIIVFIIYESAIKGQLRSSSVYVFDILYRSFKCLFYSTFLRFSTALLS